MANLALFDLYHTLIPTDSDHEWGRFMVKLGIVDADSFAKQNDRFYADYKAGVLDIHAYLVAMLTPLAKYSREQLKAWHDQYMHEVIKPAIVPAAMELVRQHKDAGGKKGVKMKHHVTAELRRPAQGGANLRPVACGPVRGFRMPD